MQTIWPTLHYRNLLYFQVLEMGLQHYNSTSIIQRIIFRLLLFFGLYGQLGKVKVLSTHAVVTDATTSASPFAELLLEPASNFWAAGSLPMHIIGQKYPKTTPKKPKLLQNNQKSPNMWFLLKSNKAGYKKIIGFLFKHDDEEHSNA